MTTRANEVGIVYILRFHKPIGNPDRKHGTAQYYVGWCKLGRIKKRLKEHRQGRGAKLTAAAAALGIGFDLVVCFNFTGTRADERYVKNYKNTRLFVERQAWNQQRGRIPF